MAILPARPVTWPSAAETAGPGTATSTTSASLASPPSRPSSVTSCPALRHSAASPPPTFPRPMVTIFIGPPRKSCICLHKQTYRHNLLCQATIEAAGPAADPSDALLAHSYDRTHTGVLPAASPVPGGSRAAPSPGLAAEFRR